MRRCFAGEIEHQQVGNLTPIEGLSPPHALECIFAGLGLMVLQAYAHAASGNVERSACGSHWQCGNNPILLQPPAPSPCTAVTVITLPAVPAIFTTSAAAAPIAFALLTGK
jgi:hypothetical protein